MLDMKNDKVKDSLGAPTLTVNTFILTQPTAEIQKQLMFIGFHFLKDYKSNKKEKFAGEFGDVTANAKA